jgi:uncharacterized repeat protein (TIGR02543 family)/uncharacterized repeat protein (TIGR01451 family)
MKRISLYIIAAILLLTVTTRNATAQTQRPGGVNNPNYTWLAWLTSDSYSNGTWTNLIQGTGSVGNFTWQYQVPPKINSGYNFHPSVDFPYGGTNASGRYWMKSANNSGITAADNITAIFVLKRSTTDNSYDHLLAFGSSYGNGAISWYNDGTDISWTWSSRRIFNSTPVTGEIVVLDNANNGNGTGLTLYRSGLNSGSITTSSQAMNQPVAIASGENGDSNGYYGYEGTIQEIILLKANGETDRHIKPADLQQIHFYLAIKYGITINNNNDYVSSGGATVWDRTANAGYSNHIFGIARDDAYGLYQKQSQSASYPLLIAFTGNSLATLNSGNSSGQLADGVYAMFGSNGLDLSTTVSLSTPLPTPGSTQAVNYRKGLMYKVQLTGASTLKLKFKPGTGALPEYMLISTDPTFPPGSTQVISTAGTVEGEVSNGSYIAFGGHRTESADGPGGVGGVNLKLWLRADDAASIVTEPLPAGSGKLSNYPPADAPAGTIVPAVSEWKDDVRNQSYTYAMGGTQTGHLEPVYQPSNYMTNYHPALRYWGDGTSSSAWLGNTSTTVFSEKYPVKHSAFFLVNNDFGRNDWIYTMMFGSATRGSYRGPGYGVQKRNNNTVGRFRTSGTAGYGTVDLFKIGATSILGYHHSWPDGTDDDSSVKFRFNGLEDSISGISNGSIGLNQASMIGPGYEDDRVIQGVISEVILYNGELSPVNLQKIESYLALKYGITLTPRPKGGTAQKFDYIFSDGMMLWNGMAGAGAKWDTWYNRVAAVIRDDDAHLHNRQSHSTNVGSILHMGVAGMRLGDRASLGDLIYDTEAVMWGDNDLTGEVLDMDADRCGDYEYIFKRTWLVHKLTEGNRPIRMIVGAQNNGGNQLGIGVDAGTKAMFDKFTAGYSVCMIVADAPEKLDPNNAQYYGDFKAVVPMQYLDGEQQCIYTFTDSTTYVTFGYKQINNACTATVEFEGTKTYTWTDWKRQNYGATVNTGISKGPRDLGDGIEVTGTTIHYASGIGAPNYYPSVTGSPVAGSLYLRRRRGGFGDSKITVTINLNTPVRPEFSIYDIDGYAGQYEQVTVTGYCGGGSGGAVLPTLSYGGNPATSYYRISDNIATATARRSVSSTNKNGQLNVSFQGGVTQIVIEFAITGHLPSSSPHDLIITPIRLRQVPPPPPINEDGLSFVKDVDQLEITTCEPVDYSFYIGNVNCEPKYVNFRDTLPPGLTWTDEIGFSAIDSATHAKIKITSYQGTRYLEIDSLYIPGAGERRMTATAVIAENAVSAGDVGTFDNHARIEYEQTVEGDLLDRELKSVDRETLAEETRFTATGAHRQDTVRSSIATSVSKYSADSTVTVTLTVTNPTGNDPVPDSYLDVSFDAGFEYIDGSFASDISTEVKVASSGNGSLSIARIFNNDTDTTGFEIPTGESTCTFQLKAPALAALVKEVDGSGTPTGKISPLQIEYIFTSETTDPCVILGMIDVSGARELPYRSLIANNDYASTLTGIEVVIPVLDNDSIPATCMPDMEVTTDPLHGEADFVNDSIRYTSESDFAGHDTLVYRLVCDEDTSYAYVYIYVAETPDNVSDADCVTDPPTVDWSIREITLNKSVLIHNYAPLTVGDIDGDGTVEILGFRDTSTVVNGEVDNNGYESRGLKMFYYNKSTGQIELKREFPFTTPGERTTSASMGAMAIARHNNKGYIVIAGTDAPNNKYLYAYDPTGARHWVSDQTYRTDNNPNSPYLEHRGTILGIADFSNDGEPEVYVGNQIFSLRTGYKLCDGGILPGTNDAGVLYPTLGYSPAIADIDGDGSPEIIAGRHIYKVKITNHDTPNQTDNTITHLTDLELAETPSDGAGDGATQVADIDNDGELEVIVISRPAANSIVAYVWKPLPGGQSYIMGSYHLTGAHYSIPMIGDIDNDSDGCLEIVFITDGGNPMHMHALKFNPLATRGSQISLKWQFSHSDHSGDTGATLFDFNQDGKSEIVYRDEAQLRIFDGSADGAEPFVLDHFNNVRSGTLREYPVIADIDDDGQAEIIVTGWDGEAHQVSSAGITRAANVQNGYLRVFKSNGLPWAPARAVWNQYAYNAVQVNNDLKIPRYPISPAKGFPGADEILGTADDIRPYNAFLHQQTQLASDGKPLWLAPDAVPDPATSTVTFLTENLVAIKVGIVNKGEAALGPPIHVALYRNRFNKEDLISHIDTAMQINKGDTGYVNLTVDMALNPVLRVVVNVNDNKNNPTYTYQPECDSLNNTIGFTLIKPMISNYMEKHARLLLMPPEPGDGTYPNPVSILYGEEIEYRITAINANIDSGTVIIRDTLPAYLRFVPGSEDWYHHSPPFYSDFQHGTIPGPPVRNTLMFRFDSLAPQDDQIWATFRATPVSGVSASQPMFVNRAWITASDSLLIPTGNSTYHQGAGVSIVTFSAPAKGGDIYNATPQALDYRTSPNSGILVVPDEGYTFTGWSHDGYTSLRGEQIEARTGIMHYDTLTVYGNVELCAVFVAEEYPVRYYLHGGENPAVNPPAYTVESDVITLGAPSKANDIFTGWTGSNGDDPQPSVTIPTGSTGPRDYYANYLHTGREAIEPQSSPPEDKIWSSGNELYIRTSRPGSIARVHTPDGLLHEQCTLLSTGTTKTSLPPGLYIITLNNSPGQKIIIK